jgi:type VI secretion system protein ImpK
MARLAEDPAQNRDVLELIYAALALGFEGRYRILDNGAAQLEAVRDRLAQILRQQRSDPPKALAQHWQVPPRQQRHGLGGLPLLLSACAAAVGLLVLHLGLAVALGRQSDVVFAQIQNLRLVPAQGLAAPPQVLRPPTAAAQPRLAQFLAADIQAGWVAVRDEVDRSVVTIRGDGLFDPGSSSLAAQREALMARIGDALAQLPGQVLVTGHTDSQPIRSARFPSNWHLSEARAGVVRDVLIGRKVSAERIRAEGRADAEPLAANDTPPNRALNRRVEITLMVAA